MSDGCVYCRMEDNGDIPRDRVGILDWNLMRLGNKVFCVQFCIVDDTIEYSFGEKGGDYVVDFGKERINYCPMCGRRLK